MDNRFVSIGESPFVIEWNKKYELGIPVIDNQHKKLVELCAEFYNSIIAPNKDKDAWKTSLMNTLRACCDYVQTHFKAEEVLLTAAKYKDFSLHKAQHDEFTRRVLTTAKNFDTSNSFEAVKFARFLYDWILSHVSYEDKKYVPCLMEYYKTRNGL